MTTALDSTKNNPTLARIERIAERIAAGEAPSVLSTGEAIAAALLYARIDWLPEEFRPGALAAIDRSSGARLIRTLVLEPFGKVPQKYRDDMRAVAHRIDEEWFNAIRQAYRLGWADKYAAPGRSA